MQRKRRYLPSLGSFATFEVAAKHLSFTLAGNELNVTQAAISQQIRGLEKALDVTLFRRMHNALELTDEGKRLLVSVTAGLDNIWDAITEINDPAVSQSITISGTHAIMSFWLTPYINRFKTLNPDLQFVLLASDENDNLRNFDDVDVSVICGNERCEVGEKLFYLFDEVVHPVCSPDFLTRYSPLDRPESLTQLDLLELHPMHWTSEAIGWYPLSWSDWFQEQGCGAPGREFRLISNSYPILIDSAMRGEGVVLGWDHLVAEHIAEGRLCRILEAPFRIDRGYYLKVNKASADKPHVQEFIDLILSDLEAGTAPDAT